MGDPRDERHTQDAAHDIIASIYAEVKKNSEMLAATRSMYGGKTTQFRHGLTQWYALGSLIQFTNEDVVYDLSSGVGKFNIGHNHPVIVEAKKSFAERGLAGYPGNDLASSFMDQLQKELAALMPAGYNWKSILSRTGSEANSVNDKIIKFHRRTGRDFAFRGAFHGRDTEMLRRNHSKRVHWEHFVSEKERKRVTFFPFPEEGHVCRTYLMELAGHTELLKRGSYRSLFYEVVQGEGGIVVACKKCLPNVLVFFERQGCLLVDDEVQAGFWRTGKPFARDHYPDLPVPHAMSLGKSLCPSHNHLSASVFRAEFDFDKEGRTSNTGPDIEACFLALVGIRIFKNIDTALIERNIHILSQAAPYGLGMMRRIDCGSKEVRDEIVMVAARYRPKGLLLLEAGSEERGNRYIRILPPINTPTDELREILSILRRVCADYQVVIPETD